MMTWSIMANLLVSFWLLAVISCHFPVALGAVSGDSHCKVLDNIGQLLNLSSSQLSSQCPNRLDDLFTAIAGNWNFIDPSITNWSKSGMENSTSTVILRIVDFYRPWNLYMKVSSAYTIFLVIGKLWLVICSLVPKKFREEVNRIFRSILANVDSTLMINELEGGTRNPLFDAAETYFNSLICSSSTAPVEIRVSNNTRTASLSRSRVVRGHSVTDNSFESVRPVRWSYDYDSSNSSSRTYKLLFSLHYRDDEQRRYVKHVYDEAKRIHLHTTEIDDLSGRAMWCTEPFQHPSTFENLAIDPDVRESIKADLRWFSARKDYYASIGQAWARNYIICGPPGTGKTSLVAAIANFLKFDVYDLELSRLRSHTQLRKLLISVPPKSILVVKEVDIKKYATPEKIKTDESLDAGDYEGDGQNAVWLSSVLNFFNQLRSSCVGERLIIFTMNNPDCINPRLLRPGGLDCLFKLSYVMNCNQGPKTRPKRLHQKTVGGHDNCPGCK